MSIQNLASAGGVVSRYFSPFSNRSAVKKNSTDIGSGSKSAMSVSAKYYSSEKLSVEYTNKDGDKVSLNYENVEYQKVQSAFNTQVIDPEQREKIFDGIRDEFMSLQESVIRKFIESMGGKTDETEKSEETTEIADVPEYWNADNTSQRIVDFATSFIELFDGSGEEYLSMIKDAVKEGFEMARGTMGKLPEPVENLVNDTYDLAMQKLDTWAGENNINVLDEGLVEMA